MYNPFENIINKLDYLESLLLDIRHSETKPQIVVKSHLTKKEAATELNCSVPMIDKLLQQRRLQKIKVGAKVLIPRESIERILEKKKV